MMAQGPPAGPAASGVTTSTTRAEQGLHPVDPSYEVVVESVQPEADGVISLFLVSGGEPLPSWAPGAHVDLIMGEGLERQYSLCGDPAEAGRWRLAVLRERESRGGSVHVHEQIHAGDRIQVRGPRNNFVLEPAGSYIFIAGGIGITPILPMVGQVAGSDADWVLVYGGRKQASMAFVEELAAYGDRVILWPEEHHGLIDLPRFLEAPRDDCRVYCCGPEALIEAVTDQCRVWPDGALHVERFRPPEGGPDPAGDTFEVYLDYSEITLYRAFWQDHPPGRGGGRSRSALLLPGGHLRHVRDQGPRGGTRPPRLRARPRRTRSRGR